ncbi:MAG: hypothetical protein IPK44_21920 [Candidatus Accumulibacter sp.]|uniref:O-antigen ligase family protein n=1 Tax=Accumulibacter sp. TaxID=2053492 RepID=UPI00258DEB32|nr:O-antigen ligase family protein [Accumulibacter sp.]MBK8116973.1 hypothetical protein [Accumulibacter sp.]
MAGISGSDLQSNLYQVPLYKPIARQRTPLGRLAYIAQAILFASTLIAALYPGDLGHAIGLAGYIGFCIFALVAVLSVSLCVSIGCLSVIAAYEPVTGYLYPGLTTAFVSGYVLALMLLLIGRRAKVTVVSAVFGAIALICMWRFWLTGLSSEASSAVRYIAVTAACVVFSDWRPSRNDYLNILTAIGIALSGVAALSIIVEIFSGRFGLDVYVNADVRLGQLNGLGANSFAYFCSMGVLSGVALLLHHRSALITTSIVVICGAGLILSKSLGSLGPIAVAAVVLLILSGNFTRRLVGRQIIGILILSVGIAMLWRYDFLSLSARDFQTLTGRTLAWAYAFEVIAANPVLGADSLTFAKHAIEIAYTDTSEVVFESHLTPHNIVLASLAYYGIFLGTGLIVVQVSQIAKSLKTAIRLDFGAVAIVFIPLSGFLIHMSIDAWYFLYWWIFVVFAVPKLPDFECIWRSPKKKPR